MEAFNSKGVEWKVQVESIFKSAIAKVKVMRIQLEQMLAKLNGIEENVDALSKRVEAQDKFSKAIGEENLDRKITLYTAAIELAPDDALALNNKAWLLATASNPQVRGGQEAVRLARESVRLGDAPEYRDTLAAAYAEAGQFDDAIAEQERAMEMLREAGRHNEIADLQTRLNLYRNGQPYRQ